ncbi:MAG: hypothetical protein AAFX06_05080 [Planctomycetota bacterium]
MTDFTLSERIELLVEGELSPDQRRELVGELDSDPKRWREVAFAFMEQEKLRSAVRVAVAEDRTAARSTGRPVVTSEASSNVPGGATFAVGRVLGLAALFLFMFTFGLAAGRQTAAFPRIKTTEPAVAATGSEPVAMTPVIAARGADDRGIVGYMHWESRAGVRRLPVFDGTASKQWLAENPPQIDSRLERLLARSGWQVRPARRLVSMQFDSGDTFTIPIDDLTYQYVGQQVF